MNLTGLEQFHQGKSDDEPTAAHLRHPRVRSTGQRVAQTTGSLKGLGVEIAFSAAVAPSVSENWIDCYRFAFLRSRYDYKDFRLLSSSLFALHLYFTGAVADSLNRLQSIAQPKSSCDTLANRGCSIGFSGCLACGFTESQTWCEKRRRQQRM